LALPPHFCAAWLGRPRNAAQKGCPTILRFYFFAAGAGERGTSASLRA
jgi:hypothetical protein